MSQMTRLIEKSDKVPDKVHGRPDAHEGQSGADREVD
jgi:hypothetical protein